MQAAKSGMTAVCKLYLENGAKVDAFTKVCTFNWQSFQTFKLNILLDHILYIKINGRLHHNYYIYSYDITSYFSMIISENRQEFEA